MPGELTPVRATFAWALAPTDATDPAELFRRADQRLLERKREAKRQAAEARRAA
jgi:hypothetical protein